MAREDLQLSTAKRAYRNAKNEGNHREEAKWANVIGDIYKNKGEYVNALQWLRVDYEVSVKHLPEKHVLPTCQSLGELYLRLQEYKDALIYQKKHLELAKDSNDLIEQQRANTQLGRTYHEMFSKSDDDHSSARNAKKYFRTALKLAQALKENPPSNSSSFLKEYIDSHNNIGMLEMELDNYGEAKRILTKGLDICDEEEVSENDDARSRLHHNLGCVCIELRMWDKAREHIETDIIICKNIGHCQGEAKGYINLGELHYRAQKYEEAILCYQKALDLAKSMEDEDALVDQIDQNIETVKEAKKVMEDMKKEEQNLKKLNRKMVMARGAPGERKCLLLQNTCLDRLIEKASTISAWQKHREFSKRKKRITSELCDKEKLGDSFVNIGESYQKLRVFDKALKWYTKGWEIFRSIGNLEGQALAKINLGNILDCDGDWSGGLDAYKEGYRIAVQAKITSAQLMALENMHYSQMIRFDNIEEATRLQLEIGTLKQLKKRDVIKHDMVAGGCSESDTGGEDDRSHSRSSVCSSPRIGKSNCSKSKDFITIEELNEEAPLTSLHPLSTYSPNLNKSNLNPSQDKELSNLTKPSASAKTMSKSTDSQQTIAGRKRGRVVLSDDEDEMHVSVGRPLKGSMEDVATSDEFKKTLDPVFPVYELKDISEVTPKYAFGSFIPPPEESTCSYILKCPRLASQNGKQIRSSSIDEVDSSHNLSADCLAGASESLLNNHISSEDYGSCITFKIDNDLISVEEGLCSLRDGLSIESLKVDVACLYYLRLPMEKRSNGLLPIIQHMKCDGRPLESFETTERLMNIVRKERIEVLVDGWVQKRLIKLYVDCCKELAETPNLKLLKKLYNLEVSEDEVIVSDCDLQDVSIMPLLNALQAHKTVAMLDMSHNLLGNGTMEKLQQVLMASSQKYGGFTLDLHCNQFGPTALFQICECPVLFTRLEVLNVSGNRLTDSCGSYLKTILENCKALYSLNIERCSLTSRTIQKISDCLDAGSALSQLSLGHNNLVTGNSIVNLVAKLSTLKRFSELNLNGIKLSKPAVEGLCQLAQSSCLSGLMLGGSCLGTDGALQLTESLSKGTQEPVKLDLSYCGLTSAYVVKLSNDVSLARGIIELNLGGNPLTEEGGDGLVAILKDPQCSLKVLGLEKCHLGLASIVHILQALAAADNNSLEELNLADNANLDKDCTLDCDLTAKGCTQSMPLNSKMSDSSPKVCPAEEDSLIQNPCISNTDYNEIEVADSEDEQVRVETAVSGFDDSCTSSCPTNRSPTKFQFTESLSNAIGAAKQLKLLNLSGNGFSAQTVETLYCAWSSSLRAGLAEKHIKEQIVHLSVQGVKCCGFKPCCKRD